MKKTPKPPTTTKKETDESSTAFPSPTLFQPGNQFWKQRATHGRDLIFSTPQKLWEAAVEYFEATDKRKWVKSDWVGKDAVEVERETETPYTMTGLYVFLDITGTTWKNYRGRADFFEVITRIENIIYTQKFEGAAVGAFNASIIARDLGLTDNVDVTSQGESVTNFTFNVVKRDERKEIEGE